MDNPLINAETPDNQIWKNRIVGFDFCRAADFATNPLNFRIHPKSQSEALLGSLNTLGWIDATIVNTVTGHLIDGHERVTEALQQGDDILVPRLLVELSEEEEKQALISIDPIAALASTNKEKLNELFLQVKTEDPRVQQMMADIAKIEKLDLGKEDIPLEDPGVQLDKADELREKWQVEVGQLWSLGKHRLICGDCTDPNIVKRVMNGEKAALFSTDPPYMVDYTGAERPGGSKDWSDKYHESNIPDKGEFLRKCFAAWIPHLRENSAWFVWHASRTQRLFEDALEQNGILVHQQIIWVKPTAALGYAKYAFRHEPCFFGWLKGNTPYLCDGWFDSLEKNTVWEIDWEGKARIVGNAHPTQKPIEIFARPMRNHTVPGEICAEPFSGSGSQIIAGEQLGRPVYTCEIEPCFVAVALQRWADLTGEIPRLIE